MAFEVGRTCPGDFHRLNKEFSQIFIEVFQSLGHLIVREIGKAISEIGFCYFFSVRENVEQDEVSYARKPAYAPVGQSTCDPKQKLVEVEGYFFHLVKILCTNGIAAAQSGNEHIAHHSECDRSRFALPKYQYQT